MPNCNVLLDIVFGHCLCTVLAVQSKGSLLPEADLSSGLVAKHIVRTCLGSMIVVYIAQQADENSRYI